MPAAIFNGTKVKILKDILAFFGGSQIQYSSTDPTTTATTGEKGDVLVLNGTDGGKVFVKQDSGSTTNWTLLGAGSEKNFYLKGDMETATTSDFVTGQDAVFDNGGTLGGTFSISTTAADLISGNRVAKLVGNATAGNNTNDFVASTPISIPQGYRGRYLLCKLQYKWDGASNNVKWVVKDTTNSTILTDGSELLQQYVPSNNEAAEFAFAFYVPPSCTQIEIGPQIITGESSKTLIWDEVIISPNLSSTVDLTDYLYVKGAGNGGTSITANVTNVDFTEVTDTHGAWDGTTFTAPRAANYTFAGNMFFTTAAARRIDYYVNGSTSYPCGIGEGGTTSISFAGAHFLNKGDTLTFRLAQAGTLSNSTLHNVSIVAELEQPHIITPAKSTLSDWISYTPTYTGFGTVATSEMFYRRVGSELHIRGTFVSGTSTATEARVSFPSSLVSKTFTTRRNAGYYFRGAAGTADKGGNIMSESSVSYMTFSDNGVFNSDTVDPTAKANGTSVASSGNTIEINASFEIDSWSSNATFLAAIPVQQTMKFAEVQTSGTAGGAFTSGARRTRTLNTTFGNYSWASLSSNTITVQPGRYLVWGRAPAYSVARHQAYFRNTADSSDQFTGASAHANSANNSYSDSVFFGEMILTAAKTFTIEHECQTTKTVDGFGLAASFGSSEKYSEVMITKIA